MSGDTTPIETAVTAWTEAWSGRNCAGVLSLWDDSDNQATYLPAERIEPLIGTVAVTDYVTTVCRLFGDIRHRAESPVYRRLTEDTGMAFYSLVWMLSDNRGPIGSTCRVTALWRKRNDEWRLFHYAEAPLAPLLELRDFYEAVAAEGLGAIPPRAGSA
ncbi:MAG: nuclear transport factor 2 family protein [Rhodospirillaceae bacterium]|nr:nuclear transport factor 2 family protein [Rhodospirillaceae bacterium]